MSYEIDTPFGVVRLIEIEGWISCTAPLGMIVTVQDGPMRSFRVMNLYAIDGNVLLWRVAIPTIEPERRLLRRGEQRPARTFEIERRAKLIEA